MDYQEHIAAVVTACEKLDRRSAPSTIAAGKAAHLAIKIQLRRVEDPGDRKRIRAETVASIAEAVRTAGFGNRASEVSRWVRCYAVADTFGNKAAAGLPLNVLRAFAPTVRRDSKTETWSIKQALRDRVLPIWQRAVEGELSTAEVVDQVDQLLNAGKKPRTAKPKPSVRDRVVKMLSGLPAEDQRVIYAALHQKFDGQVKTQAVPAPHITPTIAEVKPVEPTIERSAHGSSIPMTPPPGSLRERMKRRAG